MALNHIFQGAQATNGVSAQTVIKPTAGRAARVNVTTAGSTAGSLNDSATTGGVAAGNLIASIPNTVGTYTIDWPFTNGLVFTPGTGMVASISWT